MQHQVIEFYQQNLQLARETGRRRDEMSALASLGKAYDALEDREKAIEFYELALKIARDLGDVRAERQTLIHLNEARNPQSVKAAKSDKPAKSGSSKTKALKAAKKKAGSSSGTRRKNSRKKSARPDATSPEDQPGSSPSGKEN